MKILIVANYAKEHINKFHISTIERFKQLGWSVDVACRADADIPFADNVYDLPIERNPFRIQTILAIFKLKKILENENYDVVHVHTLAGKITGILAAKLCKRDGIKIVYSAHGFQYYHGASLIEWAFLPLDKMLVRNIDVLITANGEDYHTALKYKFRAKNIIQCCGVGVKLDKFRKEGTNRDTMRKKLGIPNDVPVLIYVAELNKNKNQIMLIKMFSEVKKKIPDIQMLLVGPDHYNGKIQRMIQKEHFSDCIHCLGWRSDVPNLIKASDIAVASSIREGFGLNIVEYMACDIPVVASDNRGHRETIEDGVTGFLVSKNDYETMAERVILLLSDQEKYDSIIKTAKSRIPNYEDETIVDRLVNVYTTYLIDEE